MRTKNEAGPYLKAYVEVATEIFPEVFTDDCCLNATRVCIDALDVFGVKAKALSVNTMAMNEIYMRLMLQAGGMPEVFPPEWEAEGAWAIGVNITGKASDGKWSGHLAAIAQGWIIDGSFGQFSRPEKDIVLPRVFSGIATPRFLKGKDSLAYKFGDGSMATYFARPTDRSFHGLPGFTKHPGNTAVAKRVVEAMRLNLKGG